MLLSEINKFCVLINIELLYFLLILSKISFKFVRLTDQKLILLIQEYVTQVTKNMWNNILNTQLSAFATWAS